MIERHLGTSLHIMHVIDRLGVGGAERMLVDLANQAFADGHRVSVCITRSGGDLKADLALGIDVVELRRERRFDPNAFKAFERAIRSQRVDVLHVHGRSSYSFVALLQAVRMISVPVLFHDHFGRIELDRSVPVWFRFAGRFLLDQYVGVYDELGAWARAAGVHSGSVHVIGNALDLERLCKTSDSKEAGDLLLPLRRPVGITVGGLRDEKGTDTLLHAVAKIRRDLDFFIVIVGGASDAEYTKRCHALCSGLQIDDRVSFAGERTDVPELLRQADFAVVPSRSESGPLVLIEFTALGLPFVATRVGDISRRVEELGLQEFVPPNDPAALADALERLLLLSDEERRFRGQVGRHIADEHFNIRTASTRWYDLYRHMVAA